MRTDEITALLEPHGYAHGHYVWRKDLMSLEPPPEDRWSRRGVGCGITVTPIQVNGNLYLSTANITKLMIAPVAPAFEDDIRGKLSEFIQFVVNPTPKELLEAINEAETVYLAILTLHPPKNKQVQS